VRRSEGGQIADHRDDHRGAPLRLVCVDVDGTLLGSDGVVHPANWEAAERARAAGLRLAICSGRPAFGISRAYAARLEPDAWHSFQNGASVIHLGTGDSKSNTLAPDVVAMLRERAIATGYVLEVYTDDDYAVENDTPEVRAHAALLGVPFRVRPLASLPAPHVRAQWLLARNQVDALLALPHAGLELSPSTSPVMPDTTFVNMTSAGVTKATAVRALALSYGISLEQVMFVGDGNNDVPAMAVVGHPVAMSNAEPAALSIARHRVAHVDHAGVAEALDLAIALCHTSTRSF